MHRPEAEDEADVQQPELPAGEPLGQHPPGHLRIPVVDAGHGAEQGAADQDEVEVANQEVGVLQLKVERGRRQHDARQAADQEHGQEAHAEEHGRRE